MTVKALYPNLRPKLLLDFANAGKLDPRITFARAGSATYFDQFGVLRTAPEGVARFDHAPVTGQRLGLLSEEQRTNSIRNNTMQGAVAGTPGTLPTNWAVSSSTSGITREIVGTGTENGITYIDIRYSGAPTTNLILSINTELNSQITAANGQSWVASWYVKLVGGSVSNVGVVRLNILGYTAAGATVSGQGGFVDIQTLISSNALQTQRYARAFTFSSASVERVNTSIGITTTTNNTIDITLRIGLPQLEQGAFATSVIPTTSAAVTRPTDVASITGANFTSFFNPSEGTVYFESQTAQGNAAYPYSLFGTTTQNRIFANYATSSRISSGIRVDNVFEASVNTPSNTAPDNTFGKGATAYKVNDFGFSWNGAAALTDTSTGLPIVLKLDIGNNGGLANNFLNGHIRKLAYYDQRLTNAQLQALTL